MKESRIFCEIANSRINNLIYKFLNCVDYNSKTVYFKRIEFKTMNRLHNSIAFNIHKKNE